MLFKAYGLYVFNDTGGYLAGDFLRSRPYPLMMWLTDTAHHPSNLVWLQIVLAAVALAALVWVLARRNLWLAAAAGMMLLIDLNWAVTNRFLLSEGAYISFSVLALAVFAYQYEERRRLTPWSLIAAGILFAWTLTIRPSNLYLLIPLAAAYLLFTGSVRKTVWLGAGIVLVLLASAALTQAQTGHFRINGGTGYYVAFPLFSYHLFDPANGPASARVDGALRSCDANVDYSGFTIETSNQRIWGEFIPCLTRDGWSVDQIDQTFTAAYVEGVRAKPAAWFESWSGWVAVELGFMPSGEKDQAAYNCSVSTAALCVQWRSQLAGPPPAVPNTVRGQASFEQYTRPVQQLYLAPLFLATRPLGDQFTTRPGIDPFATLETGSLSPLYVALAIATWAAILLLLWLATSGTARVLGLSAAVMIGYVAATVPAGHVFLVRYIEALTPMYGILTVVLGLAVVRLAVAWSRHVSGRRVAAFAAVWAIAAVACFALTGPLLNALAARYPDAESMPGPFTHRSGGAYAASAPALASLGGTVVLYEDGRPLPSGSYSRQAGVIQFTASDGSDPNAGVHVYAVTYHEPVTSRRRLVDAAGLGLIVAAIAMLVTVAYVRRRRPTARTTAESMDRSHATRGPASDRTEQPETAPHGSPTSGGS